MTLTFGADILGHPDEGPDINHGLDFQWIDYINTYNKTYKDKTETDYRYGFIDAWMDGCFV